MIDPPNPLPCPGLQAGGKSVNSLIDSPKKYGQSPPIISAVVNHGRNTRKIMNKRNAIRTLFCIFFMLNERKNEQSND